MKLTWHIVWKDLTRLRGWLAAWLAVLLAAWWLGAWALREAPRGSWNITDYIVVQMILEALLGYLIVVRLFQEDVVLGEKAFWLTRPIGRGRMLMAKVLGAAVILAGLPILLALPWWWWCGLGAVEMLAAARDVVALALLVGVPAALIGTATEHFGRAMLWSFVVVAVPVLLIPALFGLLPPIRGDAAVFAGLAVSVPVLLGVMTLVIGWLFATRRRTGWLVLAFPVGLAAFVATFAWAGTRFARGEPRETKTAATEAVGVQLERTRVETPRRGMNAPESSSALRIGFLVTQPAAWIMSGAADFYWSWPNVNVERRQELPHFTGAGGFDLSPLGLKPPAPDEETARWEHQERAGFRARGTTPSGERDWRTAPVPSGSWRLEFVPILPRSLVERMKHEPVELRARVWFKQLRSELGWEQPLAAGAWQRVNGGGMRVLAAEKRSDSDGDGLRLTLVSSTPASALDEWRRLPQMRFYFTRGSLLLAINRERKEYRQVSQNQGRTLWLKGVRVNWSSVLVSGGVVRRGEKWVPREGWLAGAQLALVNVREEAAFSREVRVEKFVLPK